MKKAHLFTIVYLLISLYSFGQINRDILKEFSTVPEPFDKSRISYYINHENLNPDDFEGHYYRGLMNLENGLYEEAIENFRHVIMPTENYVGGNDGFAEPYFNIGLCMSMLQEYDSALYYYDRALEVNPMYAEAYNERGSLYLYYGEYEMALKEFEDAHLLDAEAMHSYYNIAYANYLLGEEKTAKKTLKKVMKQFPDYDMSYALMGAIEMTSNKYKQADKLLSKALVLNPYNMFALGNRGLNRARRGIAEQNISWLDFAYDDMQRIISMDPKNYEAYSVCAFIDLLLGRDDELLKNAYMITKIRFEIPEYYATIPPLDKVEFYLLSKLYDGSYLPKKEKELATKYMKGLFAADENKMIEELEDFNNESPLSTYMQNLMLYHNVTISNDEEALFYVDLLLQSDNQAFHLRMIQALLLIDSGTIAEGISLLEALTDDDDSDASLRVLLGLHYARAKDHEKAIDYYTQAIEISPNYITPILERAKVYDILDKPRASLDDASTALVIDGTDYYAWYLAGRAYNALDEMDSALICLNYSIEFRPDYIYSYIEKQYCYRLKMEFEKIPPILDQYIRVNPYSYLGYLYRGKSKARHDTKGALDDLDKAKKMTEKNPFVYEAYGDIYYENMQDYRAAIDNYKKAADLRPGSNRVRIRIALSYYYLEEYVSAIIYYEKAMELDSMSVFAINNTGHCYSKLGNYTRAVEYFMKAIEIDSTYTNAVGNAGWNYYLLGEYDLSIKYSLRAIELDSTAYYAMFNQALATLRLGKVDEARALYAEYYEVVKTLDRDKYNGAIEDLKLLVAENKMEDEARAILKDCFGVEM